MSLDVQQSLNHISTNTSNATSVGAQAGIVKTLTQDFVQPLTTGANQSITGGSITAGPVLFTQRYVPPASLLKAFQIEVLNGGSGSISGVGVYNKNTKAYTNMFNMPAAIDLSAITLSKQLIRPADQITYSPGYGSNVYGTAGLSSDNFVLAFQGISGFPLLSGGGLVASATFEYYTPSDLQTNEGTPF